MEDILFNFGCVSVTQHQNNPHAEHPHFALYKAKPTSFSQEERRHRMLEHRKAARYDVIAHLRNIEEEFANASDFDDMDCDEVKVCYSRPRRYRNFMMLSEWLVDVPEDFASVYLAVPCPVGKRTLVVSAKGRTRAYSKSGSIVNQFPSLLPGGNHSFSSRGYAILDCIFSDTNKTFYVLDLVVWLNQSIMECDTVFRFEWLKSRILEEIPEVQEIGKLNRFRFERIPYYDCSPETLARLINEPMPFSAPLDGVLFYHNETHYTHGPTPLVGWLKAFMFPEILGVSAPESLISEKPAKYIDLPAHIQYAKDQKKIKNEKMEISSEKSSKKSKNKSKKGVPKQGNESKTESKTRSKTESKTQSKTEESEMEVLGT